MDKKACDIKNIAPEPTQKPKLAGLFIIAVAGILLAAGVVMQKNINTFKSAAAHTKGIITDIRESGDSYDVHISFYTGDGQKYSFKSNVYTSSMYKGGEAEVMYSPLNPNKARISSHGGSYIGYILCGAAVLLFILGLAVFLSPPKLHINKRIEI
ncbi:Protein of unknown function (DUF3592) [Parelusimicrobium proximum]|uniref:DUF3592 domain-containing protein n=1 Tax=Parelusimicrobium proximum TaxID=3228953 RepID=UPI003D16BE2C